MRPLVVEKKPCADCPFRRKTHIKLSPSGVSRIVSFVEDGGFMLCHSAKVERDVECAGAQDFRDGENKAEVFASESAMRRSHSASKKRLWTTWGIE